MCLVLGPYIPEGLGVVEVLLVDVMRDLPHRVVHRLDDGVSDVVARDAGFQLSSLCMPFFLKGPSLSYDVIHDAICNRIS